MLTRRIYQLFNQFQQRTNRLVSVITSELSTSSLSSSAIQLNLKMKKLIQSQQYKQALDLFEKQYSLSNDVTNTLALKACTKLEDHQRGIQIHQKLSLKSLNDSFIQTSLIHFYMQCRDVQQAEQIFKRVTRKTIYMYGGHVQSVPEKVLDLFENISLEIDEVIIIMLFNACAKLCNERSIKIGTEVLHKLPSSFIQNQKLVNSAIDMLMKFGNVNQAESFFEKIKRKSLVSYGTMMQGYVINNLFEKAIDLFEKIPLEPNEVLYSILFNSCASLSNEYAIEIGKKNFSRIPKTFLNDLVLIHSAIHMFMKFGQIHIAEDLFLKIKNPNSYTYGIMMNGYRVNEKPEKCLSMFQQLKNEDLPINEPICVALICACSQIGMRRVSENIFQQISHIKTNSYLNNCLIDMWGKSGDINQAERIFKSISQPDTVTYNSMINAYARNGMGYEAVDIYNKIPENIQDRISHIAVLNACSHSALIDQARFIFKKIPKKTEDIIITMVDCLSRMDLFDDARKLIDDYEKSHPPSLIMYTALLSGARNYRRVDLSQELWNRMEILFPDKKSDMISASILLSNVYSSLGDDHRVETIRANRIKQFGNKVQVGLSWTEIDGEIFKFEAHDRSHPLSNEIYAELNRLSDELKEHGHEYDSTWVTRPLKDGETIESVLCGHSEKLAIAFNFIRNRRPSFIQVKKNLRVCGDCHQATKLIAKIRQCQIVVRDANRIHHFHTNGQCSCQDHF